MNKQLKQALVTFAAVYGAILCIAATYKALMIDEGNQCNQAVTYLQQQKFGAAVGALTNAIGEYTAASGVTIDGVLVKDGSLTLGASGTITRTGGGDVGIQSISTDVINGATIDLVVIEGVTLADMQITADEITATVFHGANAGYGTIYIDAADFMPAVTTGATATSTETTANKVNYDLLAFPGTGNDTHAWHKLRMPEDWNLGTVKAKVCWQPEVGAAAGEYVGWELSGVAISNDDTLDAATGTTVLAADQVIAVGDNHTTAATAAMTIAGSPAAGDYVFFKLSRNYDYDGGGSAMTKIGYVLGVEIQYTKGNTAPSGW